MTDPRHLDMNWGREETDEGLFTNVRLSDPETGMVATISLSHRTASEPQAAFIASLSTLFIEALQMIDSETTESEDEPPLTVVSDVD